MLELCHVIGVTPAWAAMAVNEADPGVSGPHLRTEFVPFETIVRVTLRAVAFHPRDGHVHGEGTVTWGRVAWARPIR